MFDDLLTIAGHSDFRRVRAAPRAEAFAALRCGRCPLRSRASTSRAHGERLPEPFRSGLHVGDAASNQRGGSDDSSDTRQREDARAGGRASPQHARHAGGEREPAADDLADAPADLGPPRSWSCDGACDDAAEGHTVK
jgi:hypothetical protein